LTASNVSPATPPLSSKNGHEDLHLDRRKLARAVELANAQNDTWTDSGWWAGGLGSGLGRSGLL
jgi:hypothetical protein